MPIFCLHASSKSFFAVFLAVFSYLFVGYLVSLLCLMLLLFSLGEFPLFSWGVFRMCCSPLFCSQGCFLSLCWSWSMLLHCLFAISIFFHVVPNFFDDFKRYCVVVGFVFPFQSHGSFFIYGEVVHLGGDCGCGQYVVDYRLFFWIMSLRSCL